MGASKPIPQDRSDFAFEKCWEPVACSNIVCSACQNNVRWLDGVVANGPPKDLYLSDKPRSLEFVKASSTYKGHRVYYCKCSSFGTVLNMPLDFDISPMRSPPKNWECGGHPLLALPTTVGTISVPENPNWNRFISDVLLGSQDGSNAATLNDFCHLFGRLQGLPTQAEITEIMKQWIQSTEPHKLGAAITFYWRFPDALGAESLMDLAHDRLDGLMDVPSPYSSRGESLYSLLLGAIGISVRNGRPYQQPVTGWIRKLGLQKEGLRRAFYLLMHYDLDWTIDNFESLAATTPGFAAQALNSLTRHTRSARWDPKPAAKFVAALPGIDQKVFTIFLKGNKHRL